VCVCVCVRPEYEVDYELVDLVLRLSEILGGAAIDKGCQDFGGLGLCWG
jgi:hypothetical protein